MSDASSASTWRDNLISIFEKFVASMFMIDSVGSGVRVVNDVSDGLEFVVEKAADIVRAQQREGDDHRSPARARHTRTPGQSGQPVTCPLCDFVRRYRIVPEDFRRVRCRYEEQDNGGL